MDFFITHLYLFTQILHISIILNFAIFNAEVYSVQLKAIVHIHIVHGSMLALSPVTKGEEAKRKSFTTRTHFVTALGPGDEARLNVCIGRNLLLNIT